VGGLLLRCLPAPVEASPPARSPSPATPWYAGGWSGRLGDYRNFERGRRSNIMIRLSLSATGAAGSYEMVPGRCSGSLEPLKVTDQAVELRMRTLRDPESRCPGLDAIRLQPGSQGLRAQWWINRQWEEVGTTSAIERVSEPSPMMPAGFAGVWSGRLSGSAGPATVSISGGRTGVVASVDYQDGCNAGLVVERSSGRSVTFGGRAGSCRIGSDFVSLTLTADGANRLSARLVTISGEKGDKKTIVSTGPLRRAPA
jgi:hypothetical protein